MRLKALEAELSQISGPVLSLYLEANARGSANRGSIPTPLPWLKKKAKSLSSSLSPAERLNFHVQLERAESFLRNSALGGGALAIFSGTSKWIYRPLPSLVANELHWGAPSLAQLRRIAEEEQDVCIVAVDRAGARFFRYELGDVSEMPDMKFELDASQWKRKEHGHMARRDTKMPHGPLRDAFKKRMDQQYLRFFRHIAERTKFICAKEHLQIVMLVGSERLTKPIESALPPDIRERAVLIAEDLARIAPDKLKTKIVPKISEWIKRFAEARADRLLQSERGAILGLDETLAALQNGRIGSLLLVRGLDVPLRQCINCGDVNRSADPVCAACGSPRREVMLSQVLDGLAKDHRTRIEILDPDAAKKLAKTGGIGGWLRQPSLVAAR